MKLSKLSEHTLNEIQKLRPDNNGIFYTTRYVAKNIDFNGSYSDFLGVLETLSNEEIIRWEDSPHTAFALNETARAYKELKMLKTKEIWKERLFGFLGGVLLWIVTETISWVAKIIIE